MKNLLFDTLVEIIRYRADEHSLCQSRNLARWYEGIHLRIDGGRDVLPVDGDGLPFLQHFSETFRKRLRRLSHHLSRKDVPYRVHHYLCLLIAVVACELRKVLKAQTHRHLVAACRGNEVVESLEINRGQLVDDDRRFEHPFLIDEFYDARVIQTQCSPVDILAVGIVAHAQYLRFFGVIDVERELIARHHPIQLRRNHPRQRYLCRGNLSRQLLHRSTLPRIHEGRKIILQFGIRREDGKHVLVLSVEQFDGMRKRAVFPVLRNAQIPDDGSKEDNRAFHEEVALLLHPRLVEVEHNRIGTLVGIRNVRHEVGVDGIATVRPSRVVEVDDIELRFYLVPVQVVDEVIVGNHR